MWKTLTGSVAGSSHRRQGLFCQDACEVDQFSLAGEPLLVVAVADGAGSASHSQVGSQLACRQALDAVRAALQSCSQLTAVSRDIAVNWFQTVRLHLDHKAAQLSLPVRELACTLLVAVIGSEHAVFCQVGDGALVAGPDDEVQPVFWPQSGEYVNTTHFLTTPMLADCLMFESRPGRLNRLAAFTDGLQSVALNYAARQAHQPFFRPLFASLNSASDPEDLRKPMREFLESEKLAQRTDDDLTLVLATRTAE